MECRGSTILPVPSNILTTSAHTASPNTKFLFNSSKRWILDRAIYYLDVCISIYSLVAFILTSTLIDAILMRQASFLDDIANGVYDFKPTSPSDQLILNLLHNSTMAQSKSVGYRDAALSSISGGNTSSWCVRIGITTGIEYHAVYNNDDISRRYLRYVHTNLPSSCIGWTVKPGGNYNDTPILAVDDARASYGQSYMHCTDPKYYLPPFFQQQNVSSFRFRAGYVVAQQHNAGGGYGIETHLSYCKAEKIGDTLYYKVSPYIEGDTKDYVNVLFTNKNIVLVLLDYIGQIIVLIVLILEIFRSSTNASTKIPKNPVYRLKLVVNYFIGRDFTQEEMLDAGCGIMKFSQIWLANPWYLIGNCMYALGTSSETQTLVETFYWQWTVTKSWDNLTQAAMYAMRHAWVSVALWSFIRFVVVRIKLRIIPQFILRCIRTVESYCSCRSIILSFMLSTFVATYTRGKWYLKNRSNIADNAYGMPKSSFWESEDMQSLVITHSWALLISIIAALLSRAFLLMVCPCHHENSFLKVIEQHRLYSGFDIPQLVLSSNFITIDNRCVLILPLSDMYLIYAAINVLSVASMSSIPDPKPGNAIQFYTNEEGSILHWKDSGVHIPQLIERQTQGSDDGLSYFAVM